jgi:DNA-binding transcriptional MerR regulator
LQGREVAFKDGIIIENERLPYSLIHYPGFYGAFFGFQKNKNSQIYFCSCAKEAIENYTELRLKNHISQNSNPTRMFILDSMYFPINLIKELIDKNIKQDKSIREKLNFKNNICHECNNILPKYLYCAKMYGTKFKQNYGWFINKQFYEFGIDPISFNVLLDKLPEEIFDILEVDLNKANIIKQEEEIRQKLIENETKVNNAIENEVRQKLDHYKVGEKWTSETILYQLVDTLYNEFTIERHYRPDILEGLELDIFIKEKNIGIEYQGIQHYKSIEHWGGEEGLQKRKQRDEKKKRLCREHNIELIYFNYNEDLSEELVKSKLNKFD